MSEFCPRGGGGGLVQGWWWWSGPRGSLIFLGGSGPRGSLIFSGGSLILGGPPIFFWASPNFFGGLQFLEEGINSKFFLIQIFLIQIFLNSNFFSIQIFF